jgi:hypothetical protein
MHMACGVVEAQSDGAVHHRTSTARVCPACAVLWLPSTARESRPGAVRQVRDADVRPMRGTLLLRCLTARGRDGARHRLRLHTVQAPVPSPVLNGKTVHKQLSWLPYYCLLESSRRSLLRCHSRGRLAEWSIALALKARAPYGCRGFDSLTFRHSNPEETRACPHPLLNLGLTLCFSCLKLRTDFEQIRNHSNDCESCFYVERLHRWHPLAAREMRPCLVISRIKLPSNFHMTKEC